MSRIFTSLFFALLMLSACASAWGAAKPKYMLRGGRAKIDARATVVPSTHHGFGRSRSIGAAAAGTPHSIQYGTTWFDYQNNGSTGRQIDRAGNLQCASFMKGATASDTDSYRMVCWSYNSVQGKPVSFLLDNGSMISALPLGPTYTYLPVVFWGQRPGFTNTRNRPNRKNITVYHHAPLDGGGQNWEAQLDVSAGSGFFAIDPSVAPNPAGSEYQVEAPIWPKSAISACGADVYHHCVATWSGAANEVWYWRGQVFENAASDSLHWEGGSAHARMIDPETPGIDAIVEAMGDTVVIVMGSQDNATNADVVYYWSTDCGVTWSSQINITNYSSSDAEGFWAEISAVFDPDGNLHVFWNTVPADGSEHPVNLYHWDRNSGQTSLITSAAWANNCHGWCQSSIIVVNNGAGPSNLAIAEVNSAVKPAGVYGPDELLYAVWVQYGPTDSDCATADDQGTLGCYVNGEIYMSVSSDDGQSWDRPQNLTGTVTPDCMPGDCLSESWASAAARADSGVYISYVEDTHAGGVVAGAGAWSESPYRVMAPEARLPVLEAIIAVSPTDYFELHADPITGTPETVDLSIISVGNAELTYDVIVTNDNGGQGYVTVDGGLTVSGVIPAGDPPDVITVGFHTGGLPDPSEHYWRLEVTSNDVTNDPDAGGTPTNVNLQVFAASVWDTCMTDTLSTGSHRMQVSSCLEMGGQGFTGTGFFDYADSSEWMNSGSPVIVRLDAGKKRAWHNALMSSSERTHALNQSFRAQSPLYVKRDSSLTIGDSTFLADVAKGTSSTTDTTIELVYEMIHPKAAHLSDGFVWRFELRSLTGAPIPGVTYGVVADVDLDPSGYTNDGAGNEARGWIAGRAWSCSDPNCFPSPYLMAIFHVPPTTSATCLREGADAAQVIANDRYVYPLGGFAVDSLYKLFTTFGASESWGTNIYPDDSSLGDVSLLMVSDYNAELDPVSPTRWAYGVAVSNLGVGDLEATINALRAATVEACQITCLITLPGDVNGTGTINSSDIIYLVNYSFKGGPAPTPCPQAGDVDCSGGVTSADIIHEVNFVFKGGAPPCEICYYFPCS